MSELRNIKRERFGCDFYETVLDAIDQPLIAMSAQQYVARVGGAG